MKKANDFIRQYFTSKTKLTEDEIRKNVLSSHEWWLDLFGYLSSVGILCFIITLKNSWSENFAAIALLCAGSWYAVFFLVIKKYIINKLVKSKKVLSTKQFK